MYLLITSWCLLSNTPPWFCGSPPSASWTPYSSGSTRRSSCLDRSSSPSACASYSISQRSPLAPYRAHWTYSLFLISIKPLYIYREFFARPPSRSPTPQSINICLFLSSAIGPSHNPEHHWWTFPQPLNTMLEVKTSAHTLAPIHYTVWHVPKCEIWLSLVGCRICGWFLWPTSPAGINHRFCSSHRWIGHWVGMFTPYQRPKSFLRIHRWFLETNSSLWQFWMNFIQSFNPSNHRHVGPSHVFFVGASHISWWSNWLLR